jgi:drug/metabolite transporter (DMT)-like permease
MTPSRLPLLPLAVAAAVVVLWGGSPVATKLAVTEIDPFAVGVLRTVLAGAAALPVLLVLRLPWPADGRGRALLALSGLCGFIAFPILFSLGQRQTSAMHGGLILAMLPILTGVYAALFERRWPSRRWLVGCLLALAGEILLVTSRGGGFGASVTGDALVVLSTLTAALGYVAGARLTQAGYGSIGTTFWGVAGAAVLLLPLLAGLEPSSAWPAAGARAWAAVGFLAIAVSILGYVGWYWALARGGIARMGTVQFFQPISGLILAWLLLGEQPTSTLLASAALILAGVVLAQRR